MARGGSGFDRLELRRSHEVSPSSLTPVTPWRIVNPAIVRFDEQESRARSAILGRMIENRLVPELYCTDLERSLRFYRETLGFSLCFARPEERFAYLERDGAQLMLEQLTSEGRAWLAGPLEPPFGRGINLQILVRDVDSLHASVVASGAHILVPLEERWYRRNDVLLGQRQFVVLDPDSYLLRFAEDVGAKSATAGIEASPPASIRT
jgi:catechol 2,3-dioxygenase-like lactoylglutathione lyase family enzyme